MREELMILVADLIIMHKQMRINWGTAEQLEQLRILMTDIDAQLPVQRNPDSPVEHIYALMDKVLDTIPALPTNGVCATQTQDVLRQLTGEMLGIFIPEPSISQPYRESYLSSNQRVRDNIEEAINSDWNDLMALIESIIYCLKGKPVERAVFLEMMPPIREQIEGSAFFPWKEELGTRIDAVIDVSEDGYPQQAIELLSGLMQFCEENKM